eukprot:CAMPEP_0185490826 /NCGR_PEP_ID=MMETSP1366-20130426/14241_1 /TAXON_ID=38817 /ORGANISM="Gephyrocapsa oceanica, Strain RCC1303" /LENGTH=85 /DNA_ID=CAMNT_0028099535 /DNA_START=654 /DNA_END=907 /DNA_ORIENTATION=-
MSCRPFLLRSAAALARSLSASAPPSIGAIRRTPRPVQPQAAAGVVRNLAEIVVVHVLLPVLAALHLSTAAVARRAPSIAATPFMA